MPYWGNIRAGKALFIQFRTTMGDNRGNGVCPFLHGEFPLGRAIGNCMCTRRGRLQVIGHYATCPMTQARMLSKMNEIHRKKSNQCKYNHGGGGRWIQAKRKKITVDYRSLIYCLQHSKKKRQTSYPLFLGKFDSDFTFCPILTFRTFLLLIAMAMVPWGMHPYLPLVGKHYKHVPSRKWSIIRYFYA